MVVNASPPTRVPTQARRQAAVDRAIARATEMAAQGVAPLLVASSYDGAGINERWSVTSRTQAATSYLVALRHDAAGIATRCSCAAAEAGAEAGADKPCWHRAIARLGHTDQIQSRSIARYRVRPRPQAASAAD